jgi:hypothetical protein
MEVEGISSGPKQTVCPEPFASRPKQDLRRGPACLARGAAARRIMSDAGHFGLHWPCGHYICEWKKKKSKINKIKSSSSI